MPIKNIYSMSNTAIAKQIGERIEQLRLEANISQESIAQELGVTVKTYRNIKHGKARLDLIIGVLRILEKLELIDNFIPETPFSPLELLQLKGKQRQRASRSEESSPLSSTYPPHTTNIDAIQPSSINDPSANYKEDDEEW